MKQTLAILLLPLVLLINGCTWCKVQCKSPSPQNEVIQTQNTETEIITKQEPAAQDSNIKASATAAPSTEEPKEIKEESQKPSLTPSLTTPKKAEQPKEETPAQSTPNAPQSYINEDGRYLHPWAARPVSKDFSKANAAWKNEQMQFGVHYTFIRAGTAYISTKGITETDFGPAYLIETLANSAKVIDHVFKVRDINYSWISVKDYSSYGYAQSIREGKYVRDEWITFDTAKKKYFGIMKKKGNPNVVEGELPGAVQDMLTSLYYVRMQDLDSKKDIIFDVANREKTYPLIVKVLGKETVKVPAPTRTDTRCWFGEL